MNGRAIRSIQILNAEIDAVCRQAEVPRTDPYHLLAENHGRGERVRHLSAPVAESLCHLLDLKREIMSRPDSQS